MKKYLLLIPLLFASFAIEAGDWEQGFVVTLTNGKSYITKDASRPFEYDWCQRKTGSVSLPIWYHSDFIRAEQELKKIGAIVTGEGEYGGWNLLYLDPINIASIDLIDEGWFFDFEPKRYDHAKLLRLAHLPSDYGKPIPKPEPPVYIPPATVTTYDVILAYGDTEELFDAIDVKIGLNGVEVFFEDAKEFGKTLKRVEKTTSIPHIEHRNTNSIEFSFVGLTEVWKDENLIYENRPVIDEPNPPVDEPNPPVVDEPKDPVVDEPKDPVLDEPRDPVVDEPKDPVIDEPNPPVDEPVEELSAHKAKGNHGKGHHPMAFPAVYGD